MWNSPGGPLRSGLHAIWGVSERATARFTQALGLFGEIGDRSGEAWARNGLGEAARTTGHSADALTHHTAALTIAIEIGARDQQARAHTGLGHAYHALADPARARRHYQHALALYTDLEAPEAADVEARLAAVSQSIRT
jgi:tetratricopeptide (TPR) repeat protein